MSWSIISTWRMALDGTRLGAEKLKSGETATSALEEAIKNVEDNPEYKSVGYGGLPNEYGEVELDAAIMDGNTLSLGAVAGISDIKNPISLAKKLSGQRFNVFLVGRGAEEYAQREGFQKVNMLTEESKELYKDKLKRIKDKTLTPYDGHDTVCVLALDKAGNLGAGTSTSGLFMKKRGRVGDSPIVGSGYYADSEIGAAAATGLGEDIMKGCLSYEAVRRIQEGMSPQEAAESTLREFSEKLIRKRGKAGAMSIICMDKYGQVGVGTNVDFTFVTASHKQESTVYLAECQEEKVSISELPLDKLKNYE